MTMRGALAKWFLKGFNLMVRKSFQSEIFMTAVDTYNPHKFIADFEQIV